MEYTYVVISTELYVSAEKHLPKCHFNNLFELRVDYVDGCFTFNLDKFDNLRYSDILNSIKLDNNKISYYYPVVLTLLIMNIFYLISLTTTIEMFYPVFLFVVLTTLYAFTVSVNTHRMIRESKATDVLFEMVRLSSRRTDYQLYSILTADNNLGQYNGNRS